ncbi:hypothetical protein [Bacteroides uniformis]|uniref:hypothetical protein n=1 Tax=Bacteroides uniformis TaxID=820 RepID=UPI00155D8D44|nr:hypothetical protein [Bacteroides uniformis]
MEQVNPIQKYENQRSIILSGAFCSGPKKAPEFAPGILHRNATFCLSFSNAKSSDSVENQSFS